MAFGADLTVVSSWRRIARKQPPNEPDPRQLEAKIVLSRSSLAGWFLAPEKYRYSLAISRIGFVTDGDNFANSFDRARTIFDFVIESG